MADAHSGTGGRRLQHADLASVTAIAGFALGLSALITLVFGLYTLTSWWGWFFIGFGIVIGVTAALVVFDAPWAGAAGAASAMVSFGFTALWAPIHMWFAIPILGLDVLAIFLIVRSKLLP
jgi:hypothetical protein